MNIKETINDLKKWIILILIAIFSYWIVNNISEVSSIINLIITVLHPFILGGIIAFILNIPMKSIERFLINKIKLKNTISRIISIIISLMLFLLVLLFVSLLLIPELIENIELLINSIPGLFEKIEVFIINMLDKYPDLQLRIQDYFSDQVSISTLITNVLNYIINGALGFVKNILSGLVTVFTSIVFAIYMLSQKEQMVKSFKKIVYAIMNKQSAGKTLKIAELANNTFSKFISGQCVEAIILGTIIFITLSIFKFPYALIISVITSVTALIPIFGALIALLIGTILIGITSPIKALLFIIVFEVIQQIEGNFIYPKVVGKSVGLSPLLTLLAITVGGSLFGVMGMLIGLPLASILYVIIKEIINKNLEKKKIIID